MKKMQRLKVGDVVQVRSREEILNTLDVDGQLDGLPFMPEMFAFCGQRLRVFKSAHKTCDTVNDTMQRGRSMRDAVHLENARCNGRFHGGCQAGCLIFWKTQWLKPVSQTEAEHLGGSKRGSARCSEADVLRSSKCSSDPSIYVCQATRLPTATKPLAGWNVKQYIDDYVSGNVGVARIISGLAYRGYERLINLGIGLGPLLRVTYDLFQHVRGGTPYPGRTGTIAAGERTPSEALNIREGEFVRVKNHKAILATCDQSLRNRGMAFDAEMVPYCGRTFRVLKRVTRIVNEKTGRMQELSNPCLILEGVTCEARYSECRLFCPRSIYSYWREIWLERVTAPPGRS